MSVGLVKASPQSMDRRGQAIWTQASTWGINASFQGATSESRTWGQNTEPAYERVYGQVIKFTCVTGTGAFLSDVTLRKRVRVESQTQGSIIAGAT